MAKGFVQVTESARSISAKILFEVVEEVDKRMRRAAPLINLQTGALIETKLRATPHIRSIISGKLQADFGLTTQAAESAVDQLISAIKQSVKVNIDIRNRGKLGSLAWSMSVTILPEGFSQLLSQIGTYSSHGNDINWMEWLLTKGATVVCDDFFVAYGTTFKDSRSGFGVMYPSGGSGRIFRVDPVFAGTQDDNFVVNSLTSLLPEIANIMFSYLL